MKFLIKQITSRVSFDFNDQVTLAAISAQSTRAGTGGRWGWSGRTGGRLFSLHKYFHGKVKSRVLRAPGLRRAYIISLTVLFLVGPRRRRPPDLIVATIVAVTARPPTPCPGIGAAKGEEKAGRQGRGAKLWPRAILTGFYIN